MQVGLGVEEVKVRVAGPAHARRDLHGLAVDFDDVSFVHLDFMGHSAIVANAATLACVDGSFRRAVK